MTKYLQHRKGLNSCTVIMRLWPLILVEWHTRERERQWVFAWQVEPLQ